LNQIRIWLF